MSHIVRQTTEIKDLKVLNRACAKLGIEAPVQVGENYRIYLSKASGAKFTVLLNLTNGTSQYDSDYRESLYDFERQYAMEAVRVMAEETGATLTETIENGNLCFVLE